LGFLGCWPFGRENPRLRGLEKLGFPWILSSETRLFNGLRRIFAEQNFSRPFAVEPEPRPTILAMWKGRIVHKTRVTALLVFCKKLPALSLLASAVDLDRHGRPCAAIDAALPRSLLPMK
jgi:hypothetical protein